MLYQQDTKIQPLPHGALDEHMKKETADERRLHRSALRDITACKRPLGTAPASSLGEGRDGEQELDVQRVALLGAGKQGWMPLPSSLVPKQPLSSRPSRALYPLSSSPCRCRLVLQPEPLLLLGLLPVIAFDSGEKLMDRAGSTALLFSD